MNIKMKNWELFEINDWFSSEQANLTNCSEKTL
jgi:hypothetical protein